MNSELLKELSKQLLHKPDLYSFLQLYSVQTWNKIGFVRNRKGLRINETTITQNLVFDFWQLSTASNLPIEIYESTNEKANGNDLEIFVETDRGFLLFPCQAKIIQKNNRYSTIHHRNKNSSAYQMELLITYANRNKGVPIYLFYNFYHNYKRCFEIEEEIGFPLDYFGCSIVSANYLKENFPPKMQNGKALVPSFEDLHPFTAFAFHDFFNDLDKIDIDQIVNYIDHSEKEVHYYSEGELNRDTLWKDMAPLPAVGFVINEKRNKGSADIVNIKKAPAFEPKFRIIITKARRQLQIKSLG